jgi:hypothetical protein
MCSKYGACTGYTLGVIIDGVCRRWCTQRPLGGDQDVPTCNCLPE